MITAIIVAAGSSRRMGFDKLFAPLAGKPVIAYSIAAFEDCKQVDEIVIVSREERIKDLQKVVKQGKFTKVAKIVAGGSERHFSVWNGLQAVNADTDYVAIHDGARPLVTPALIKQCIDLAKEKGAVSCSAPIPDTVKRASTGQVVTGSVERSGLWAMQTPQVFSSGLILQAYASLIAKNEQVTDEVSAVQKLGKKIALLRNDDWNLKITFPRDLEMAEHILAMRGKKETREARKDREDKKVMDFNYRLTRLKNGTRIATAEMPHMESATLGIWAGVGGRHEPRQLSGVSHFIEHLLFKGTKKRSARKITEAVEGIGGYLNAFTTEDHTCYYAKACASHLPDLCDVLSDMYLNSQFNPPEIEREREVIGEEIRMYKDNPAHHVQELLSQTMWQKHPLGRPLTGTIESISSLNRSKLMGFMRAHYNGCTTIVTAAGKVSHDDVVAQLEPLLGKLPAGNTPRFARYRVANSQPKVSLYTQETEQTHLAMAFYSFGRLDERRFALKLLSVILGENMSSRLFQKLREKYGFCYSVQSGMVALADAGVINISAGLDTGKLEKALRVILEEVERFCHKAPARNELRKAQDYTIGQTLMGMESTTNQMMWLGESLLGHGKILDPAKIQQKIMAVTPEQIQAVACHCLRRVRLGVAIVGPTKEAGQIKGWLR